MKAVKTIAALIFVSALAIVLVQPVLDADDDGRPRAEARDEPSDPDEPSDTDADRDEQEPGRVKLLARYPRRCLRDRRAATGLVAARRGSTATIGVPDRVPVARIEVSGDVAWSPSGTFLAERGGRVFDPSGNPQGALFFEPRQWQWSPVADCALATTERGNLTFSIPDTPRKGIRLLNAPVTDFDLSPNGRRLAAVIEDSGLWIGDLRRGRIVQATEGRASLVGWFSNRYILFSKSKGEGKLRYAAAGGKTRIVHKMSAGGTLVRCGGRVLIASPTTTENAPLLELEARQGRIRREILPSGRRYEGYSSATCSPDGSFMAASAVVRGKKGPLALLDAAGTFVRELAPGATGNPQWSDDGLMFVRFDDGRGRLWLVAPGAGAPAPTAYDLGAPTQYDWHVR